MLIFRNIAKKLFSNNPISGNGAGSGLVHLNSTQVRTAVIYNLPKPTEVKRVRKQGYLSRVKTPSGRKYMMTRILRGDKIVAL